MALVVDTLDYSGLYNAINLRRGADTAGVRVKELALRKEERDLETFQELTQIALDVADVVFTAVSEVQLSKAKLDAQKDDLAYQKLARDAVLNNEVTFEEVVGSPVQLPSGAGTLPPTVKQTIKMPKSLEDFFQRRGEEIDKEFGGFPKIKAWARDQLYSSFDIAQKQVMSNVYTKAIQDKATLEGKLIEGALGRSIQEGTYDHVDAAITASSSLTPAGKEVLRTEAHAQVDFGQYDKAVRAAAAGQGYDVAMASVAQLETTGKVTPEQARALEAAALSAAKTAEGVDQQRAETALQAALTAGEDSEKAVDRIVAQTPEHNRSGVKRLLDATVVQIKKDVNDKADAEIKAFYDKNQDNAVGLDLKLHNPSAKYAERMDTPTYMFWESLAHRALKTDKEKEPETPKPLKDALYSVVKDNRGFPTPDAKTKEVRRIIRENPLITADTAKEYLSMAEDKVWTESSVNASLENIDAFFKVRESQALKDDKTGAKLREVQIQREGVIREFTRWLKAPASKEGYTDAGVILKTNGLLSGYKSQVFKADEATIYRANMPIDRRRLEATGEKIGEVGTIPLTIEEANQIEQADRDSLTRDLGIKPEQIVDAIRLDNDLTQFIVGGLNPGKPDAFYRLTFRTNPDTMNEELMVYEKILNAKGEEIGGNWIPSALPTVREVDEKRKKAAAAAAAKAEAERKEKLKQTVGAIKPTVAAITDIAASTKGTTVQEVAEIATGGAQEPSAIQVDQITAAFDRFGKKGALTSADIQRIAKDTGITEAMVLRMAVDRGWKVAK